MPRRKTLIETTMDDDLEPFSAHLWRRRIAHRVYERQGRQVLEITSDRAADLALAEYRAWREGRLTLDAPVMAMPRRPRWDDVATALARYPCLTVLIVLAIAMYPATWPLTDGRGTGGLLRWLTFTEPGNEAGLIGMLESGELWRLVTPALLHFSLPHLLFNLAVVWEFGRRIELRVGSVYLALVVVAIAAVSNSVQYIFSPNGLFGGLSGVAYGLFAYVVTRARREPGEAAWRVNPSLTLGVLILLVIMTTGVTEVFGLYIANAAHWTGLATGALFGLATGTRRARG